MADGVDRSTTPSFTPAAPTIYVSHKRPTERQGASLGSQSPLLALKGLLSRRSADQN